MHTSDPLVERVLGSSWEETVGAHAPGLWRRLLAQAPYWQAVDVSDVTWLRLADALEDAPGDGLGTWLERTAQEAIVEVRESPWRTPSVPLGVLGAEPPNRVMSGARGAIGFRLADATIARPSSKRGLRPASDRGMELPWRTEGDVAVTPSAVWERTFEVEAVSVDLVLFADGGRRLVGVARGADLTAVTLRTPAGERMCAYEGSGWFRVLHVPEGPVSVVLDFESDAGDRKIVTEWRVL